jgi:hypothetical protein
MAVRAPLGTETCRRRIRLGERPRGKSLPIKGAGNGSARTLGAGSGPLLPVANGSFEGIQDPVLSWSGWSRSMMERCSSTG